MRAKQLAPQIDCGFLYEGQKHGKLAFQAKEARRIDAAADAELEGLVKELIADHIIG